MTDLSRVYFDEQRRRAATPPPADAPTLAETIARMVQADEHWYALNDGWVS